MQASTKIKFLRYIKANFELYFWLSALVALYFMNVRSESLCLFRFAGFNWCPGCGLGHALNAALHFNFASSFNEHPFGIPALLIIVNRIKHLLLKPTLLYEQQ